MIRTAEERAARDLLRRKAKERAAERPAKAPKPSPFNVEAVVLPTRLVLTPAQKHERHRAHNGRCYACGAPVPVAGPLVQYDHVLDRQFRGPDTVENMAPMCTTPCHARKTAAGITARAKADRRRKKHNGEDKPKRKIPSQGFAKGYRPMPSRGSGG